MRLDPEDPRPATKPRILFVEDEPMLRAHLAEALSEEYCVDTAGTGREALTVVLRAKPDLVVTDIVMPEMDGVELLKTLRSVPSTQAIPVLLLSGHAPEEKRVEGFREGADGYLAKPYSERELRALIGSMIQSARQRAEAVRREATAEAERQALADRAALLESITDAFFALDRDWRFTYVNQRALDYYGKERAELLGRSIWDVFPAAAGTMLHEQYEKALRTQCSAAFETKSVLTGRWVDIRAYPTGQGLAVYFRDMSERKNAERELQAALGKLEGREWRLNLATRAAGLAVFSWDSRSDRITFESEPPREILILAAQDPITGAHFLRQLVHRDDRRALRRQLIRCIRSAELLRGFCRIRGLENSWRWIEINGGCERPNGHGAVRLVGVVRDVTARRQIEEALRESDRRKDEFLALLSHELRNPLAPIANGLSLLKLRGSTEAVSQRALGIMERQLNHLVRLVDDLLDVGRMTHGKLRLRVQRVSLLEILGRALEGARTALDSRCHTLTTEVRAGGLMLEGDADRLIQVFTNLVHNSAKYTDTGGLIRITLDREADEAVVAVTDNGVGIPPHALEQVFEMFSQVKLQQPRAGGGLGIGLALVRAIVQMHGGTIRAASAGPGLGSTFTVRLPLADGEASGAAMEVEAADAARAADAPGRDPARQGPRILVVDDNSDAAASLADLLQLKGHAVLTAASGEEAIAKARLFRPQIIFMDIGLPGIDGVETALRIRAIPELRHAATVAVTGWGQPSDRARTRDAGFVAHLLKPVAPEMLERILAQLSSPEGAPR